MAKIIAYTRTDPTPVGVDADLYTAEGDPCIMIRTFEGVHGQPVPLDDLEAEKLANTILSLVERLREQVRTDGDDDH